MYTLDIDLQKRLYNLWPAYWISMILFFILGLFVYKSFFTLVVMMAAFTRHIRQMKREHKKLIEDPKERAFVNLNNDDFKLKTKGKTVLVVGHSNTTPQFVIDILNRGICICDRKLIQGEEPYNAVEKLNVPGGFMYRKDIANKAL